MLRQGFTDSEKLEREQVPCDGTAEGGHFCVRLRFHTGAHRAASGHWWPWPFEGQHSSFVYSPLSIHSRTEGDN